jgi:hypothetical protein
VHHARRALSEVQVGLHQLRPRGRIHGTRLSHC